MAEELQSLPEEMSQLMSVRKKEESLNRRGAHTVETQTVETGNYLARHLNSIDSASHSISALCSVFVQIILEGLKSCCDCNEIVMK